MGELLREKHTAFLQGLDKQDKNSFEACSTEHIRMQGIFWGLGAADILKVKDEVMPKAEKIAGWVMQCYNKEIGGFGGNVGHDANIVNTQHAVYVLAQCGKLERIENEKDKIAAYVKQRQLPDGSFSGDEWGEVDTRFSYCALACLSILKKLDQIDLDKAAEFILECKNFDGGFGAVPGAESHAGYIWTAVASLAIINKMHLLGRAEWDKLAWWLAERQCDSGGLNGRPEKQADVCYSWWALSTLHLLERSKWIDSERLVNFIYKCQDPETGGIADRPENVGDVYHTFFGLAALVHLTNGDFNEISHAYALPSRIVSELIEST